MTQKHPVHTKVLNTIETQNLTGGSSGFIKDFEEQRRMFDEGVAAEGLFDGGMERTHIANPEYTTIFDLSTHRETVENPRKLAELKQEMTQLTDEIKGEVAQIRCLSQSLNSEAEEISKVTLQSLPEKPGVYHIRYLEILLSFLRGLRQKVGEARTWMSATQTKKAKRGSAFVVRSKKSGTQYSMSQELQTARSVQ